MRRHNRDEYSRHPSVVSGKIAGYGRGQLNRMSREFSFPLSDICGIVTDHGVHNYVFSQTSNL